MKIKKCRWCGANIIWIKTMAGKAMPCDPQEVMYKTGGAERIVTPHGEVVACTICETEDQKLNADGIGYIPHWATCAGGVNR